MKEMCFQQKPLEKADFIVKLSGLAVVRRASSDKWKAPLGLVWAKILLIITRAKQIELKLRKGKCSLFVVFTFSWQKCLLMFQGVVNSIKLNRLTYRSLAASTVHLNSGKF